MKKPLLFTLLTFFIFAAAHAQVCVPVHDFGDDDYGVYPDTNQNFIHAMANEPYLQQVDVKLPANGDELGIPLTIDSAQIVAVTGLPAGLTWECGDPDCTYNGGETGCGVISGTTAVADTFELEISTMLYVTLLGSSIPYPMNFTGYRIIVEGSVGVEEVAAVEFALLPSQPNPAQDHTRIRYTAPSAAKVGLQIYDLLGKQVLMEVLEAAPGANEYVLRTDGLESGLYIYTVSAYGKSLSRKLTIKH